MIERCRDRQRKFDGLQQWPFHSIIESLPVMLQIALLLLACGLCRYIMTINTPVAWTLVTLTSLGVLFYLVVAITGASSYDCPFQTPGSAQLHSLWKKVGPLVILTTLPIINNLHTLRGLLERIKLEILRIRFFFLQIMVNIYHHFWNPPPLTTNESLHLPNPYDIIPWLAEDELAMIQKKNVDDIPCISWVLKDITDPDALDAAIQLAGTIGWFENGTNIKPFYDLIISAFDRCFSNGMLHQELENRAYYSGWAILWIHTLAVCKSEEFADAFPFPTRNYQCSSSGCNLQQLIHAFESTNSNDLIGSLLDFHQEFTHTHSQWTSSILLHLSWAIQTRPNFHLCSIKYRLQGIDSSTPLYILFNLLLMCCNLLDSPIGKDVLKIQDKS